MKSKGELEAEISRAFIEFEKEYMGRGPLETKSYILDDMVVVRLKKILTPAELKLVEADEHPGNRELIKQARHRLLEHARPLLEKVIWKILGVKVRSMHTDLSTRTGERIIVFTLEEKVAKK
jgi:uncharacterized protein YbcI